MPLENEEIKDTAEGIGTQAENAAGAEESAASREEAQVSAEEAAGAEAQAEAGNDEAAVEAEAEQDPAAEAEALKMQLAEGAERMKRLQADFENFRRRTRQEKEELSNMVVQDFIKELLPMLDNFDRAMAAEATDAAKFQQGVEMIYNQLTEILKNKGMELIDTAEGLHGEGQGHPPIHGAGCGQQLVLTAGHFNKCWLVAAGRYDFKICRYTSRHKACRLILRRK